jgi:hypothetical protein
MLNMVGEYTFMEMTDKHIMFGHACVDLFAARLLYQDIFHSRRIPDRKPFYSTDGKGDIHIHNE